MRRVEPRRPFLLLLSEEEREHLTAQADAAGLTRSALIRRAISGVCLRTSVDLGVLRELSRLGGLVKHLYNQGAPPADTSAALRALENAARKLAAGI